MKEKSEEQIQLEQLKEKLEHKNRLVFLLEESIPIGETERKKYVADIALFYKSVFKDKLQHFISDQLTELAQIGRTERWSDVIRAHIDCFRLIDEWMEKKTNEHIGNVEEARKSLEVSEGIISEFKDKYN